MIRYAKVKESSSFYKYFKDVTLTVGYKGCWSGIPIYGCVTKDERRFYEGVLAMDKEDNIKGFESVIEVEEYWLRGGDGSMMVIPEDELIIIDQQ